jgi:hypothetical protein
MASSDAASSALGAPSPPVLTWSRPPSQGAAPCGRGGHSATQVGNLCVIFGGTFYDAGKFQYLGDVWALDVETLRWHKPTLGGGARAAAPGPRYGHSCVLVDWKLFVFGGKGDNGLLYNDLWCLDVETWTWELMPTTSSPPSPRMGHASAAVDGKLVVLFGWDGQRAAYSDVWVYDRALFNWSRPRVQGAAPPARSGAACVYDEPNARLVVFGGQALDEKAHPSYLKDTRELDLRSMVWSRSHVSGDYPPERYAHAAAVVGNVMVSFGGWRGPAAAAADEPGKGRGKAAAAAAAAEAALPPAVKAAKLALTASLVGGNAGATAGAATGAGAPVATVSIPFQPGMGFGDVATSPGQLITVPCAPHADTFLLDLGSLEWVRPLVAGKAPGNRYGATAVAFGLQVLVFGGWEGGRALAELLVLDLSAIGAQAREEEA